MASSRDRRPLLLAEGASLKMRNTIRHPRESGEPVWIPAFAGMTNSEMTK
jgi:hypothetical protein